MPSTDGGLGYHREDSGHLYRLRSPKQKNGLLLSYTIRLSDSSLQNTPHLLSSQRTGRIQYRFLIRSVEWASARPVKRERWMDVKEGRKEKETKLGCVRNKCSFLTVFVEAGSLPRWKAWRLPQPPRRGSRPCFPFFEGLKKNKSFRQINHPVIQ